MTVSRLGTRYLFLIVKELRLTGQGKGSTSFEEHSMLADFSKFIITVSGDSGGWDSDLQLYPVASTYPIPEAFIQSLQ